MPIRHVSPTVYAGQIRRAAVSVVQATCGHVARVVRWLRSDQDRRLKNECSAATHDLFPKNHTELVQITAGYFVLLVGVTTVCTLSSTLLFAGNDATEVVEITPSPEETPEPEILSVVTPTTKKRNTTAAVHEADRLLSHPDDPMRKATGVKMGKINFGRALPAVLEALQKSPASPRHTYQLGRAYDAGGDTERALEAYHKAADLGYPMAFYNLAWHYHGGRSVPADAAKSKKYCEHAAAAGIKAAEQLLRHYDFDGTGFSDPKLFQSIYAKTLELSTNDHAVLAGKIQPFLETFFQCKEGFQPVSRTAYARVSRLMTKNALKSIFMPRVSTNRTANVTSGMVNDLQLGRQDAQLFYDRYGCKSEVAKQFFSNLEHYIRDLE